MSPLIYIVEDDADIADLIEYQLLANGYRTEIFYDGDRAYSTIVDNPPDLLLLDLSLPGLSGMEIIKYVRNSDNLKSLPIIIITAKGQETDKVIGLKAGADDYITKPFGLKELVARIESLLRRLNVNKQEVFSFGNLTVNFETFEIVCGGTKKSVSPKESRIFKVLIKANGEIVTYDELINALGKEDIRMDKHTLYVYIQRLRNKLGSCKSIIKTVQGVGYRLELK